jgi:hypothetical protein
VREEGGAVGRHEVLLAPGSGRVGQGGGDVVGVRGRVVGGARRRSRVTGERRHRRSHAHAAGMGRGGQVTARRAAGRREEVVGVVGGGGQRGRRGVMRGIHHLSYFLLVRVSDVVSQFRLLITGHGHPLVRRSSRRRGVRRVEAGLDQRLACVRRDHRLQLARRERVDVSRLARDKEHHLRAGQRRQLVSLKTDHKLLQSYPFFFLPVKLFTAVIYEFS